MLEVTVHDLEKAVVHDLQEVIVQPPMLKVVHQGRPVGAQLLQPVHCPAFHHPAMAHDHVGHLHHGCHMCAA